MRTVFVMALATMLLGNAEVDLLRKGEAHFHAAIDSTKDPVAGRRDFAQAAWYYNQLIERGCHHADVFLNAGNAWLLADNLPEAILSYRRGLRRYPLDNALWENLELARDQVAYPAGAARLRPPGDDWPPFLPRLRPNAILSSALGLYGFAWVAVTAWLMTRRRWVAVTAAALFAAAVLTGGWWGYLQYRMTEDQRQPLVVVAVNGITLRRGNGSLYPRHPDLPQVNRGMEAQLLSERGEWVHVQFPSGEIGWLPLAAVLVDRREPSMKLVKWDSRR